MPEFALAVNVNWLPGVALKTISEVEREYRRYRTVSGGDKGPPVDVSADVVDDFDYIFAQRVLWEDDGSASLTADDRPVVATYLTRLSHAVPTSGSELTDPIQVLVDEV